MLAEAALPDDPQALRAMLVALQAQVATRDRQIEVLVDARTKADAELTRLAAIIATLQRHRFGARSEQLNPASFCLRSRSSTQR